MENKAITPSSRRQMLSKIHIAKKQLGFDDESYRLFLFNTVGKSSCRVMSDVELVRVLGEMQRKGFQPKAKGRPNVAINDDRTSLFNKIEAIITHQRLSWAYAEGVAQRAYQQQLIELERWQLHKVVQMLAVSDYRKKMKS